MEDKDLVTMVQKGSNEAFDELMARHHDKVLTVVSHYIRDSQEGLDIAQEVFLKVYRSIDSFRGDSSFYTWLYRIAMNTAKNHLAARNRRPMFEDIDMMDNDCIEASLTCIQSPELQLCAMELSSNIVEALAALPDHLREVFILREIEDLSYDEIAAKMSCPKGTVRSRLSRARALLQSF